MTAEELPCVHRGPYLTTLACCGDVFRCGWHDSKRCTLGPNTAGLGACEGCGGRAAEPPAPPQETVYLWANQHGLGDAVTTAWISEGSKSAAVRLVHKAEGEHRELLAMLGQEVADAIPDGGREVNTYHTYGRDELGAERGSVDRTVSRGRGMGVPSPPRRPPCDPGEEAEAWAEANAPTDGPLVLLFPQTHYQSRLWPKASWVELAWRLRQGGYHPRLMLHPNDSDYHNTPDYYYGTGIRGVAALMKRAACVVGNDSGPMHLAGTIGAPTVALLGPTNPAVLASYDRNFRPLQGPMGCVGCHWGVPFRATCDRGCPALAALEVGVVYNAVCEAARPEYEVDAASGLFVRRGEFGAQDRNVIGEVVHDDCYGVRAMPVWDREATVVDVGGHIGSFARMIAARQPRARVYCVEACPENVPLLKQNLGQIEHGRAAGIHAALSYDPRPKALLNSVMDGGTATGGSVVMAAEEAAGGTFGHPYRLDARPLVSVTLENVMHLHGRDRIDLLKLDCEGSEFDILAHSPAVHSGRVARIVGEYHGEDRFRGLMAERFADGWDVDVRPAGGGSIGYFELRRRG